MSSGTASGMLRPGAAVTARFQMRTRWYPGVVRQINDDGTVMVDYDDGDHEPAVLPKYVKLNKGAAAAGPVASSLSRADDAHTSRAGVTQPRCDADTSVQEGIPSEPTTQVAGAPLAGSADSLAGWVAPSEGSFIEVDVGTPQWASFQVLHRYSTAPHTSVTWRRPDGHPCRSELISTYPAGLWDLCRPAVLLRC